MKAVMCEVPEHLLAWRKKTDGDQWDEMWEGVLHMPPMPSRGHQELEGALESWLRQHWARPLGNKVYHNVNLVRAGGWPSDYRGPDLLLLTPGRFYTDKDVYFEGAPDCVVEIESPYDESRDKMEWYARLGVPDMWIIDRDSKQPELYSLVEGAYQPRAPDPQGWLTSALGMQFRCRTPGRLEIRMSTAPDTTLEELPN
ncbi:MAG TPA: Uma2 family endonuclease [Candidatus Xenobia bacterium]|jgi:Uma2 family endonuclease